MQTCIKTPSNGLAEKDIVSLESSSTLLDPASIQEISPNSANTSEPERCFLFELPQELLDEIFELAFTICPHAEHPTPNSRGSACRLKPYNKEDVKITDILVSKQFFQNAARAWLKNIWLDGEYQVWWSNRALASSHSFLFKYAENMLISDYAIKRALVEKFPWLKRVCVVFLPKDYLTTTQHLRDDGMRFRSPFRQASQLRGLVEIKLMSSVRYSRAERQVLNVNVARIEERLKPLVTRQRLPASAPKPQNLDEEKGKDNPGTDEGLQMDDGEAQSNLGAGWGVWVPIAMASLAMALVPAIRSVSYS